jgi:hypothetical protein
MAGKHHIHKTFIHEWEPPHFRERRGNGVMVYIIAVVAVLLIVSFFSLKQSTQSNKIQVQNQQTQPVQTTNTAPQGPITTTVKSVAPAMDDKCIVVAGIVPGSIKSLIDGVSVTFKNNGRTSIKGSYFEFSNGEAKAYRKNSDALAPGEQVTYDVKFDDAASEIGSAIKSFVIIPIQDEKACINQRMVVIDYN